MSAPSSIKLLGISGSLRKQSYNSGALRATASILPEGLMDSDEGHDPACGGIPVRIPDRPVQRFGMQVCAGVVLTDQGCAAGEQLELRDSWILGRIDLCAAAGH